MEKHRIRIGVAALAVLSAEVWTLPAAAADYAVSAGTTDTNAKTVSGTDTVTVDADGKLSVNKKAAIDWNGTSTDLKITSSGTIESTKSGGRAIDATGSDNARTLTLRNKEGATITSDDDAMRIGVNPTGGSVTVNNYGTIHSTVGQALDFDKAASGSATITIFNGTTGTIKSDGEDAIRPGQGATIDNSGSIYAGGGTGTKNDGIDFKDNTAGTVSNYNASRNGNSPGPGTISGARHGITLGGSGGSGSITVTNGVGATITGRNGSGVGSDAAGTVTNYGTIEGAYSGDGTQDGDGDGVDIDYAGTIANHGTIKGTGAGGYDKNGRANNSEGISLGGGTITNSGTISGAAYGIVVNNDSNTDNSRSGVAATTITNDVGGTIEGKGGYAIRLENKTGTAADADTIVNKGTIIGNGTIPDPSAVVLLKNGSVDGGSVGTLDGVRYTGTGAARFIRGDGAAIQMGEGNDSLTNYGTITGNSGRAISLEGGDDTLTLYTGSTIAGRIDGGTGTDTINLDGTGTGTLANVVNVEALNVKGGTWALTDDHTYARGATVASGATLTIGNGATAGSLTADIATTGALVFDRSDAASDAGTISGSGSVTKVNTGTLTLSGIHTYTGATTILGGTLALSGAGSVTFSSGVALATGATLDISGLTGAGTAITALTDAAPGHAGTVALGARTLAITNANGSFGGTITGSGGLMLAGGNQTLTGANTYTGATTISHGTLTIQNATALGAADGTAATGTTVVSGAALELQGGIAVGNEALSLAGMGVNGYGALRSRAGTNSYAGAITLTDTGRITVDAGKLTLSGPISGTAGADRMLVLKGAGEGVIAGDIGGNIGTVAVYDHRGGTWTLTGHSRLDGDLWVLGGGLRIAAGGTVTSTRGLLGNDVNDVGTVTVTGAGSRWTDQGALIVGSSTSGLLAVADGGVVSSASSRLGGGTGTTGSATVMGPGSAWISSDTLVVGGSGTGTLSVAAGGSVSVGTDGTRVLDIAQQNDSTGTLIIGAAAGQAPVAAGMVKAGEVKFGTGTGTLTFNHTGNPDGSAATFAPRITGAGTVNHLAGTTILTGASTFTGTTTVSGGTLILQNATALGAADGTAANGTLVSAGATLALQGGIAVGDEALSFAGRASSLRGMSGTNSYAGAITLTDDASIAVDAGSTLRLSGSITGIGGSHGLSLIGAGDGVVSGSIGAGINALNKIGSGTWTLTGQNAGDSIPYVSEGTLRLADGGTLSSGEGFVGYFSRQALMVVTGANTRWNTRSVYVGASGTGTLTVAEGGTVAVDGGTGTVDVGKDRSAAGTLAIGAVAGQAAVAAGTVKAGEVRFGAGTGTLVFNHTGNPDGSAVTFAPRVTGRGSVIQLSGTTVLTAASTYTGTTTVSGGTLSAANATALGTSAATVTPGGTLDVNGVMIANPLTLSGTGAGGVGALTGTGTAGVSGPVTLAGNATFGGPGTLTVAGSIGDGGSGFGLTKVGTGTVLLTGANTYAGGTAVTAGTLALGGAGTLGSTLGATTVTGATAVLDLGGTRQTQAAVSLSRGATLRNGALAAPVTSAGATLDRISGAAALTTTAGTTVSIDNTYTGATTVGDGSVLQAGGAGGFSAASVHTLAGTGILDLAGSANTVGALTGSSTAAAVTSSAAGPAVLTVAGLSDGTFAGTIRDGAGRLGLTLAGGTLTLTGASTYTGATTIARGATLQLGDGGSTGILNATSGVANDGTLVFDRADTATFASAIAGSGALIQAGRGTTILTGRNTYTGATTVVAGTLQIDGVLTDSEVTVKRGATLSGSGKIGDPLIEAGGRLAPGSAGAIGTLSIHGPLTFAPGSLYTVKLNPTANDRTAVTGPVTIQGGTVQVLAGSGTYTPALHYTLITATGGITGTFTTLQTTSNLAFLTPSLTYDRSSVTLGFSQTAPLISAATTANQAGPAVALNGTGPTVTTTATSSPPRPSVTTQLSADGTATTTVSDGGGATTTTVVSTPAAQVTTALLNQTAENAARALSALSGEIHASAMGVAAQNAVLVQGALLDRLRFGSAGWLGAESVLGGRFAPGTALPAAYAALSDAPIPGLVPVAPAAADVALWGQGLGAFGNTRGARNAARLTRETGGFLMGLETGYDALTLPGLEDLRVGVAAGYSTTAFDTPARAARGQLESTFGAAYARAGFGPLQLRAAAVYGRDALDMSRRIQFPGFSHSASGRTGAETLQGFGEVGYRIALGGGFLEPFAGGGALRIGRTGFAEAGGPAALHVFGRSYAVQTATAGLQGETGVADLLGLGVPVRVHGLIGYRRAFGDVVPTALLAFRGGGTAFRTAGAPIDRDALVASAGLEAQLSETVALGASYAGQVGARARDHAVRASLTLRW